MPNVRLCLGLKSTFLCKTKLITLHKNTATNVTKNGPQCSVIPNKSNSLLPFILMLFIGPAIAPTFSHTVSIIICTANPIKLKTIKSKSCPKPLTPFFFFGDCSGLMPVSTFEFSRS